jgi:hypothetical protein
MGGFFGHKGHLVRVAALFAVGVVVFVALQALLVPKGFGVYGHYRAGALDDNRARPPAHAGRAACVECHSDVWEPLQKGKHAGVHCEACHGPLARHAEDPSAGQAVKPDPKVLCARCHEPRVARPATFPQVDPAEHSGGESCTSCHKAHDPLDQAAAAAPAPAGATPEKKDAASAKPQKGAGQ